MTSSPCSSSSSVDSTQYIFPKDRLQPVMKDPSKTPVCLVACGSFSPITILHLVMFEMAVDYIKMNTDYEVVGAYLSPVSDAYKKIGLESAEHRIRMCQIAAEWPSTTLMVDPWEAQQSVYQPTAIVLDHFDNALNSGSEGGIPISEEPKAQRKPIAVKLLAGADLIQTMSTPGVWSEADLKRILGDYGTFIIERRGTDLDDALSGLQRWKDNIWVIQQGIQNDVSSTKIRFFLRRGMSVQHFVPEAVIQYIREHELYKNDRAESIAKAEKANEAIAAG